MPIILLKNNLNGNTKCYSQLLAQKELENTLNSIIVGNGTLTKINTPQGYFKNFPKTFGESGF